LQRPVERLVVGLGGESGKGQDRIGHPPIMGTLAGQSSRRRIPAGYSVAVADRVEPVACAQVNDCSTAAPERGCNRTVTLTGSNPSGRNTSPCTCWKYLNEYTMPGSSSCCRRASHSSFCNPPP